MSPEQTRGEALDRRTDIWSFGCSLYEALTGRRPFKGNSISEILAAVLTAQPDFGALPRVVPRSIRHLLRRCLEKDVDRRLHDISDARIEIEAMLERDLDLVEEEDRPRVSSAWIVAGMAVTIAVGWALGRYAGRADVESQPVRRFAIELPTTEAMALGSGPAFGSWPRTERTSCTRRVAGAPPSFVCVRWISSCRQHCPAPRVRRRRSSHPRERRSGFSRAGSCRLFLLAGSAYARLQTGRAPAGQLGQGRRDRLLPLHRVRPRIRDR